MNATSRVPRSCSRSWPRPWSLLLALLLAGCAGTSERWAEVRFAGISYPNLYRSVADVLESEGFPPAGEDTTAGTLETEWAYGTSIREVRGPSRRKVFVRIERGQPPEPEEGAEPGAQPLEAPWVVSLRVTEEVIRKGGLLARNPRQSDDWEEFRDNFEDAELLAEKVRALLSAHHVMTHVRAEPGP